MPDAVGVDKTSLDSYSVRTYDKNIILAAHGDNGIMYSVYGLLNRILGYEYYGATASANSVNISDEVYTFKNVSGGGKAPLELLNFDDKPAFEQREVFLSQNGANNVAYLTKMKLSTGASSTVLYGEGSGWLGSDRSIIEQFLPYFDYRDSYPIWYSDSNGAKAQTINELNYSRQICFSALLFNYTNVRNADYSNFNNYCLLDSVDANGNYFDDTNAFGKMMNNILKMLKSQSPVRSDVSTYTLSEIPRRIIFLGVEDNDNYCRCEKCKQLVASYQGNGHDTGCYSDLMVRVANKVSQAFKAWQNKLQAGEFTCDYLNDIGIPCKYDYKTEKLYTSCWAYRDLLEAPHQVGVYGDDVIIRLASVRSSFYYPMNDERNTYVTEVGTDNPLYGSIFLEQEKVNEEIAKWQEMGAKRFAVWDYGCYIRGNIIPFPDWYSLQGNLQYYQSIGVTEVITQLNGFENPDMKTRVEQPLHNLKMYLRSKLLWNPNENVDALTTDYFKHYYKHGKNDCSKEMLEYYKALQLANDSLDKNATDEYYYRLKAGDIENNPLASWDKKSTTGSWTGANGYSQTLMNSFKSGANVYVNFVKMYAQNTLVIPANTISGLSGTKTFKEYIVACYNKAVTACNGDATLIARLQTEVAYINYLNANC